MRAAWIWLVVLGTIAAAAWALTIHQLVGSRHAPAVTTASLAPAVSRKAPPKLPPPPIVTPTPVVTASSPAPYVVRHVLPVTEPMRFGDWYWNEAGAPPGEVVITVDVDAQVISAFRGGYEIGTAVILYGADAKPTPLGVLPVRGKEAMHRSRTYGNAPMPYTMWLTDTGVAIHGTSVRKGYMTHGCIGVPTPFAKRLFGVTPVGTTVIVTRGERLKLGEAIKAA